VHSFKLTLKNISYYRDIKLHFYIFYASLKIPISIFPEQKKGSIHQLNQKVSSKKKTKDKEKITRYISLYFRLLGKFGFSNTCLTRSVLLCYVLRKFGYNAKINFGIKTDPDRDNLDLSSLGHCWVSLVNSDYKEKDYDTISQYPLGQ